MKNMLKLWSSSDGLTLVVLIIQGIVIAATTISLVVTIRKAGLERQTKADQAIALATAQRDAADARLETARLNSVLMPIELSPDQQKALAVACQQFSGKAVEIRANSPDPESWLLADLIAESLRSAGLEVNRVPIGGITFEGMGSGLTLGGPDQEFVAGLKLALETEGKLSVSLSSDKPKSVTFISLGTRPFVAK